MTSSTLKEPLKNHIKSFGHEKYFNKTELSKHNWYLKQNKTDFTKKMANIITLGPGVLFRKLEIRTSTCLQVKKSG